MSSLSHCWQIKKQFWVWLKCALTLQYFILNMKEIPFFENGLWCRIILHTIGSLVGHMCHTITQWMLGRAACEIPEISLFSYLAVSWKESFCAQRGGILSGMRQKHARSCQVLFWTLWSNNHASLIFSPDYAMWPGQKSSWAADCQVLSMLIQKFSMLLLLRATYLMFVNQRDLLLHLGQEQVYNMKILCMLLIRQ